MTSSASSETSCVCARLLLPRLVANQIPRLARNEKPILNTIDRDKKGRNFVRNCENEKSFFNQKEGLKEKEKIKNKKSRRWKRLKDIDWCIV